MEINELVTNLDTYMNLARTTIAESDEPIMVVKLTETFVGLMEIFSRGIINIFPTCMVD